MVGPKGFKSMKNSNYIVRKRTHDLLACMAMSQPTAPPRAPDFLKKSSNFIKIRPVGAEFDGRHHDVLAIYYNIN